MSTCTVRIGLLTVLGVYGAAGYAAGAAEKSAGRPREPAAGSLEEPAERRRLPSLLSGATPEERTRLAEERKRISAAAAAAGTDPTAIIGYYQLSYGHNAFTNGLRTDSATAVVRLPLTPNWLFQVTLPYVWADLNRPSGGFTLNGTSDLVLRTGGRLYASENVALFAGIDASFPAASERQLGTGKYTLGPAVALAAPLPRLQSLSILLLEDFNAIGGDPSRTDIHFLQVQSVVNTFWSEHWWTLLTGTWDTDWNNRRKPTLNLLGQIGYRFDNHWNVFVGAGGGVVGKDTFLGMDWNVQAGVRWVFGTPLIPETFFGGPRGPSGGTR